MNANRPKGNQKHIDLSGRIRIEQGLNNGESLLNDALDKHGDTKLLPGEVVFKLYDTYG